MYNNRIKIKIQDRLTISAIKCSVCTLSK